MKKRFGNQGSILLFEKKKTIQEKLCIEATRPFTKPKEKFECAEILANNKEKNSVSLDDEYLMVRD